MNTDQSLLGVKNSNNYIKEVENTPKSINS